MILAPTRAAEAFAEGRLDAKYHCSPGVYARERMEILRQKGIVFRSVAGKGGYGVVAPTSRTKRVYAAPGEDSVPYLRPYDAFDYLPQPADQLSVAGSEGLDVLIPEVGTILQTCSGRNLGPSAYTDEYIARFAISDDMLRLRIAPVDERLYVMTFLSSPTGQALLTQNKTGGVIDHLSAVDLSAVAVPMFSAAVRGPIVAAMRSSVELRESARVGLDQLITEYSARFEVPPRTSALRAGWTVRSVDLFSRVDSAYYEPQVQEVRAKMLDAGGVLVGTVAEGSIPGRYKRYYVGPSHGRAIVSGRQLLQSKPVNLRYIAARSFDFDKYALREGMIAFGAEGRAEERISLPAFITSDRSTWLANNHVMRVMPKPGIEPGWLYLAFAVWQTQVQVRALSTGSVVDAVNVSDLDGVVLPPIDAETGAQATAFWNQLAEANALEQQAIRLFEAELDTA